MRIKIERDEFLKGLHRVQGIVERRQTMPILANILLSTKDNKVEISATDLEVGIKETRRAEVVEEGSVIVNAKKIYEIVRELPEESIEIKTNENNWLEIKSGRALFNIVGLPSEEFPSLPDPDLEKYNIVKRGDLRSMIEMTHFAVSQDETRYNLNGVYIECGEDGDGVLRMVATDGHRLAIVDRKNIGSLDLKEGIIIPKKGISELKKILDDGEGEIEVGFLDNSILFKTDATNLIVRIIDGDFPDYRQIIPKENDQIMRVEKEKFLSVARRMAVLSSERSKGINLSLSPGKLEVTASNPDIGDAKEVIDVDYAGENISIIINSRYLIDGLNAIDENEVVLVLKNSSTPGILKPLNREDYIYIIMPMRF